MRLSWGQGAVAALVLVVAAGMLELPSRVLGPARAIQGPINLPQSLASPAVVLANPPVQLPTVVRVTAQPRARVVQPIVTRLPAEHVAPRPAPRRARPSPAVPAPPLDATLGRANHLPLPPDEARPAPPAPAPTPTPAPTPAATPTVPAATPTVSPTGPTPTESTPTAPPPATEPTPSCGSDSRPGWGNGDQNHCHTGPPGHDGGGHGHDH